MSYLRTPAFSRRRLLGGVAGLAAAGALSACGPGGSEPGVDLGSAEEGSLVVWGGLAPERGPGPLVEAFMAAHPGIKVEYVPFVNNAQGIVKLDTALQGGVPIDVYFSYGAPELVRRITAGLALDLTEMAGQDEQMKMFTADPPVSTRVDGKLFSIPTTHYPEFVLVNQDAIDRAGIEIPFDWTADDYRRIATELVSAAGFETGAYNPPRLAALTLGGDSMYKSADESNFDHPVFREELEYIRRLQEENAIFTQRKITAEKIDTYPQNYFLNQTYGMFLNGTASLRFVGDLQNYPHDFRTTFRPYPAPVAGQPYWNPGGLGDSVQISAKSQYPSAAWTFIKFWLNEGAPLIAPAGKISPFDALKPNDEVIANMMGPDRDRLYDIESFKRVVLATEPKLSVKTMTKGLTELSQIKSTIEAEVRLGTKTIDVAVTEMKRQGDAALASAS